MATPVTPQQFSDTEGLDDWRVLRDGAGSSFRLSSFSRAAAFVAEIGAMADALDHHPSVDLRFPGVVRVIASTHSTGGLSDLDIALARQISAAASRSGASVQTESMALLDLAIDATDIAAVLPFWRAVLGYDEVPTVEGDGSETVDRLRDPQDIGPPIWFQQMDEPREQRNRIHLDLRVPHDQAQARIDAALAAGGTMRSDRFARAFWVLADPEGNEVCICTWQDRDQFG